MEQGFDKEIDSLLRRGRGGATSRVGTEADGGGAEQAHLDADELSAFAEGALPSAARLAAATHLADCAECRGAAVGLVRAAGVEAALERSPAAEPSASREAKSAATWRDRLGALFAPRVLRFVAPVLAVCLLGALAFVALRSRQSAPELARDVERQTTAPRVGITAPEELQKGQQPVNANTTAGESLSANLNTATNAAAPSSVGTTGAASATAAGPAPGKEPETPAGAAPAPVVSEAVVAPQPSQGTAGGGGAAVSPPPAPKAEPADEDKAAKAGSAARSRDEVTIVGNTQQQNRAANTQTNPFEVQSPDDSRAARRAPAPRASAPAADEAEPLEERADSGREKRRAGESRQRRSLEALRVERESAGGRSSAEERNAAGRRFRREGGAWVDVNYKPSMSSTGVRRGTDAYRALVADHPEVDRAARQLSGEFVIVIGGRAYRVKP
jgi:hypothetical protein